MNTNIQSMNYTAVKQVIWFALSKFKHQDEEERGFNALFWHLMVFVARQLSISEAAVLLGFSPTVGFIEMGPKKRKYSVFIDAEHLWIHTRQTL